MNVADALLQRKSTRAFTDQPVAIETIHRILDAAKYAPSGTNTQPWQVAVVTGTQKRHLDQALEQAYLTTGEQAMDYAYYPDEWVEPYKSRRRATGMQLYSTLQIERTDKDKQKAQWLRNYSAFGAPVVFYFFIDRILKTGSYMDYGMFLQSIMLMAVAEGLATCPQAALGQFPALIKETLGYPQDCVLLGGMALGYEDKKALINSYRTPRLKIEEFTKFFTDN